MPTKKTIGVVLGKFLPPHTGHELFFQFAQNYVDELYIIVDHLPPAEYGPDLIPGRMIVHWIKQMMPKAIVSYLPKPTPQDPKERPDFWLVWKKLILSQLPRVPDFLFASESYGFPLAKIIGTTYIPFNPERNLKPISGTKVRANLRQSFNFLPVAVKPNFTLKVCIFGPESSGKSTLTRQLARHFQTQAVPEYARYFLEAHQAQDKNWQLQYSDLLKIAQGQIALENSLLPKAQKIIFSDTDPLATTLWSQFFFHRIAPRLQALSQKRKYDLYLLAKPDLPWKKDSVRFHPDQKKRELFFTACLQALKKDHRPYVIIDGQGPARTKKAIKAIQALMTAKFNYRYFTAKWPK